MQCSVSSIRPRRSSRRLLLLALPLLSLLPFLLGLPLAGCRCAASAASGLGLHDGLARYVGRVDVSHPRLARFEWPGSGVVARFVGTGVAAFLSESPMPYEVVVDHGPPRVVTFDGRHRLVSLASDLPRGEHVVELYRRAEALWGPSAFEGFLVTDGALLQPPPPPTRRLEFIGDSIFAGYGIEGCPFSPETENEYLSVSAVTARALSAEHTTLAWTGLGLHQDAHGRTEEQMPARVGRTLPSQPASRWDFSRWTPDAVVIDLGDNDFEAGDSPNFVPVYLAFLAQLRAHYPDALLLCAMGPMRQDASWRSKVHEAVAARRALGDAKVDFFEFAHDDGSRGQGCDGHPDVAAHARMAEELIPVLRAKLGW